jgi:hypothetical protein
LQTAISPSLTNVGNDGIALAWAILAIARDAMHWRH